MLYLQYNTRRKLSHLVCHVAKLWVIIWNYDHWQHQSRQNLALMGSENEMKSRESFTKRQALQATGLTPHSLTWLENSLTVALFLNVHSCNIYSVKTSVSWVKPFCPAMTMPSSLNWMFQSNLRKKVRLGGLNSWYNPVIELSWFSPAQNHSFSLC